MKLRVNGPEETTLFAYYGGSGAGEHRAENEKSSSRSQETEL